MSWPTAPKAISAVNVYDCREEKLGMRKGNGDRGESNTSLHQKLATRWMTVTLYLEPLQNLMKCISEASVSLSKKEEAWVC